MPSCLNAPQRNRSRPQATHKKSELEILLHQTKTGLSQANNSMGGHVSEILEEHEALQEGLNEVKSCRSRHAQEMVQERARLRDLKAQEEPLRAQLDKAIVNRGRMHTTVKTEL